MASEGLKVKGSVVHIGMHVMYLKLLITQTDLIPMKPHEKISMKSQSNALAIQKVVLAYHDFRVS